MPSPFPFSKDRTAFFKSFLEIDVKQDWRAQQIAVVRNIPQVQLGLVPDPPAGGEGPAHRGRRNFCRWSKNILVPSGSKLLGE